MDASKKSKIISPATFTAGPSGANGSFNGFVSNTDQTVFVNGPFCYLRSGLTFINHLGITYTSGFTMAAKAGMAIPVKCTFILPSQNDVVGFIP
jgi:hypothetical protein